MQTNLLILTHKTGHFDRQNLCLAKKRQQPGEQLLAHVCKFQERHNAWDSLQRIFLHGDVLILKRRIQQRHNGWLEYTHSPGTLWASSLRRIDQYAQGGALLVVTHSESEAGLARETAVGFAAGHW